MSPRFHNPKDLSVSQSINYEGVCRTAPATQGLLNIIVFLMNYFKINLFIYTSIYHPIFMSSAPKKVHYKRRHGSIGLNKRIGPQACQSIVLWLLSHESLGQAARDFLNITIWTLHHAQFGNHKKWFPKNSIYNY